jgi:hypothetical protein
MSTIRQNLTMYRRLVVFHYVQYSRPQSLQCLRVPHTVPTLGSASLCTMLSSTDSHLSVSISQCTVSWFCVTMSKAVSTVCPQSVSTSQCTVSWFCATTSLCPVLSSTVCPISVNISYCTVGWFCDTMFSAVF